MLMVTRKPGERVIISLDVAARPDLRASELFADGPIEIIMAETGLASARLAISAPGALLVSRAARP